MIRLPAAAAAWPGPDFLPALKAELQALDADSLPLQQGLRHSSHVLPVQPGVVILHVGEAAGHPRVKVGLFYAGTVAGCSCADDPSPADEIAEYCEVLLEIDPVTAAVRVTLLEDG